MKLRKAYPAAGRPTLMTTRAGRVGVLRERKSRTGPRWWQNGHMSCSVKGSGSGPMATGASQRRQASVPVPSCPERTGRRTCSWAGPAGVWQTPEPGDPTVRVNRANAAARMQPVRDGFINAVQVYPFAEGALYRHHAGKSDLRDVRYIVQRPDRESVSV